MNFYNELEPFIEYLHSIRKLKTYLSIDLKFPVKWVMPKSIIDEASTVAFDVGDTQFKGISFVCEINKESVNNILTKISKIIKVNKEKEIKEKLFKQVVEDLKTTFEKTDLNRLTKLYFDFDEETDLNLDEDEQTGSESEDVEVAEQRKD